MSITFKGKVIKGLQVGAKFGIATANLEIIGDMPGVEEGVYLVEVKGQELGSRERVNGILHIGKLKTFGREKTCEVHLLDFEQEIYGEILDIEVLKFVRPTKKFQNADMLYTQIESDIVGAEKYFLRKNIYEQWNDLSKEEKETLNTRAFDEISKNKNFLLSENIYTYASQVDREIDFTELLMEKFPDKHYFFPRVIGEGEMEFCEVETYLDLEVGTFRILEPKLVNGQELTVNSELRNPPNPPLPRGASNEKPDIIFIPSVAVDLEGNRLGKGGGFYDRWLASHKKEKVLKIAVMPKFSIVEKVPVEAHDQKVDMVISV